MWSNTLLKVLCNAGCKKLTKQAVAAVLKLSRDPHIPTKLVAATATSFWLSWMDMCLRAVL